MSSCTSEHEIATPSVTTTTATGIVRNDTNDNAVATSTNTGTDDHGNMEKKVRESCI